MRLGCGRVRDIQAIMEAIIDQVSSLLVRVARDYGLDPQELLERYGAKGPVKVVEAAEPKKAVAAPKVMCSALTAKGKPCRFKALDGCKFCGVHNKSAEPKEPVEVKEPKKAKKAKKVPPPVHNHLPGEKPEDLICHLCDSHGDVLDPQDSEAVFEDKSIKEKLKSILETSDDQETLEPPDDQEPQEVQEEDSTSDDQETLEPPDDQEPQEEDDIKNKLKNILAEFDDEDEPPDTLDTEEYDEDEEPSDTLETEEYDEPPDIDEEDAENMFADMYPDEYISICKNTGGDVDSWSKLLKEYGHPDF